MTAPVLLYSPLQTAVGVPLDQITLLLHLYTSTHPPRFAEFPPQIPFPHAAPVSHATGCRRTQSILQEDPVRACLPACGPLASRGWVYMPHHKPYRLTALPSNCAAAVPAVTCLGGWLAGWLGWWLGSAQSKGGHIKAACNMCNSFFHQYL